MVTYTVHLSVTNKWRGKGVSVEEEKANIKKKH